MKSILLAIIILTFGCNLFGQSQPSNNEFNQEKLENAYRIKIIGKQLTIAGLVCGAVGGFLILNNANYYSTSNF